MNLDAFQTLCEAASAQLGLEDVTALGCGFAVVCDEVALEANFNDGDRAFLLLADLGVVAPEDSVSVYQALLTLQLSALDTPAIRFGFHPLEQAAVLCVPVALHERCDGTWLADLVRCVAAQVHRWRQTVLAGKAHARAFQGEPDGTRAVGQHVFAAAADSLSP